MRTIMTLAVFLVIGFVGSRGFVKRATQSLPLTGLFATGMEFFLLGILAGPGVLNLITQQVLTDLEPVIYLSLGWIGLLFGIDMSWKHVRQISRSVFRTLLVETIAFVVVFSGICFVVAARMWPELAVSDRLVGVLVLGISAAVSSPTVVALVAQRLPARGAITQTVKITSALSATFPLVAFGMLFVIVHPHFMSYSGWWYGPVWWLFINAVGLILGFVMVLFTWERTSDNEMLLLVVGTVLLIGGVCYYLGLPSLYTALIMGVVAGNFSRMRDQVFRELHHIEQTLFLAFLVIVGAMIDLSNFGTTLLLVCGYVALRMVMKYLVTGSLIASAFPEVSTRRSGLALSGQGVMAMAIALDGSLATRDTGPSLVVTVVALSVMVNDVVGFAVTRAVLRRAGEAVERRARRSG